MKADTHQSPEDDAKRGADSPQNLEDESAEEEHKPSLFAQARGLFYEMIKVAVLVLLLRAYVLQASSVEGQSMQPTLHDHDMLLVERFSAAIINSPSWLRSVVGAITPDEWMPDISRGDIVVLASPENSNNELVKRVIAVGGDYLFFYDGKVWVNGEAIEESYLFLEEGQEHYDIKDLSPPGSPSNRMPSSYLPSMTTFEDAKDRSAQGKPGLARLGVQVPEDCLFLMGDNRGYEKSNDSRAWTRIEIGSNSPGSGSSDHLWATKRDVHGRVVARLWPFEYDDERTFWVK